MARPGVSARHCGRRTGRARTAAMYAAAPPTAATAVCQRVCVTHLWATTTPHHTPAPTYMAVALLRSVPAPSQLQVLCGALSVRVLAVAGLAPPPCKTEEDSGLKSGCVRLPLAAVRRVRAQPCTMCGGRQAHRPTLAIKARPVGGAVEVGSAASPLAPKLPPLSPPCSEPRGHNACSCCLSRPPHPSPITPVMVRDRTRLSSWDIVCAVHLQCGALPQAHAPGPNLVARDLDRCPKRPALSRPLRNTPCTPHGCVMVVPRPS